MVGGSIPSVGSYIPVFAGFLCCAFGSPATNGVHANSIIICMKRNTYKIYTLGCKANQYDSFQLQNKLADIDISLVKNKANLAIINTCCVTKMAMRKSHRMINKARKENPEALIAVIGCWPKVYENQVKRLDPDFIYPVGNYRKLMQELKKKFNSRDQAPGLKNKNQGRYNKARYFLKIQDGCEQFCSYCIIPYARGSFKSRQEPEIINEVKKAIEKGHDEIVLSGIHLGRYGYRQNTNLAKLLAKLVDLPGLGRIRLSSIEINEVSDELIALMEKSSKICRHLHIPLQSGSNKILKLMKRPYTAAVYRNRVKKIRNKMPDIALTTDVITGFPGETDKNFRDAYNFIKEINFSRLHVFNFSAHEKTAAAKFPKRVERQEKEKRAREMRALGGNLARKYKDKFIGRTLAVVVERKNKNKFIGKSEYYFDIEFGKTDIISNEKIKTGKMIEAIFNNYPGILT